MLYVKNITLCKH